ncbi:MAG TPA: sulfite exporter TauE/SafE family protein, partial [Nitrospirota bacterium]|nr:sulfite exporter TauE/SafE family protein [Nitrospirota bacterium]
LHSTATGSDSGPVPRIISQILYNAGRLTTYSAVGAVMGIAGSFVNVASRLAGLQNSVMVVAGIVMIIMGLGIVGATRGAAWLERHNRYVLAAAKPIFRSQSAARYYPLGLVLGLLPCGFSYTAFIAAAGTGAPLAGFLLMLSFGAGTVPALALFGFAVSYFGSRLRAGMQRAGGAVVIAMGLYYVLRGIRLYAEM